MINLPLAVKILAAFLILTFMNPANSGWGDAFDSIKKGAIEVVDTVDKEIGSAVEVITGSKTEKLSKSEWRTFQTNLNTLGYNVGTPDGSPGPRTQNAVRQYLADNNLDQKNIRDGYVLSQSLASERSKQTKKTVASVKPQKTSHKSGEASIFERMSMQFLQANMDKIQPETAAAMYAYAVKNLDGRSSECKKISKISNSIDAREKLNMLHAEMRSFFKANPNRYDNHVYTVTKKIGSAYEDYDFEYSSLMIDNLASLEYKVDAKNNREYRIFTPCNKILELPYKARLPRINTPPKWFKFKFDDIIRYVANGTTKDKNGKPLSGNEFFKRKLELVPMSSDKAKTLLKRNRRDKDIMAEITFTYKPTQPFYALDDELSKKGIKKEYRALSKSEWSHNTTIQKITYYDKKTNAKIHSVNIGEILASGVLGGQSQSKDTSTEKLSTDVSNRNTQGQDVSQSEKDNQNVSPTDKEVNGHKSGQAKVVSQSYSSAAFKTKSVREAMKKLGATNAIKSSKIKIINSIYNGAQARVDITSEIEGTSEIILIIGGNPTPLAARYIIARGTVASISARYRVKASANLLALVKANGRYYTAEKNSNVKIGGFIKSKKQPFSKKSRIQLRSKVSGGKVRIKTGIGHPMAGYRGTGYITEVLVTANGEPKMTAHWSPNLSENPYLSFSYAGSAGDKIKLTWKDSQGKSDSVTHKAGYR